MSVDIEVLRQHIESFNTFVVDDFEPGFTKGAALTLVQLMDAIPLMLDEIAALRAERGKVCATCQHSFSYSADPTWLQCRRLECSAETVGNCCGAWKANT